MNRSTTGTAPVGAGTAEGTVTVDELEELDGPAAVVVVAPALAPVAPPPSPWRRRGSTVLRWVLSLAAALGLFALLLWAKGADPWESIHAMWTSAFGSTDALGETFVRACPLLLAALAVAVPARAGLFNIGGQGQLILGAIGGAGTAYAIEGRFAQLPTLILVCLGGMVFGALWASIPVVLRLLTSTNEAITSLLLNYVAAYILTWLVFEPWKDPHSTGQPYSRELEDAARMPILWGNRVHAGVAVALGAAVLVWLLLTFTRWGFMLRVLGGNPEAARRAGLSVGMLALSAILVGGALAGLGGAIEVSGVETRLRNDMMIYFGYIGFLASWLARHDPLKAVIATVALGGILVGGRELRVVSGLSEAAVTVLMALVLLAVLGFAQTRRQEA